MVFLTSSIDGLWLGSLSQQRVIRVSMGSGRSLIRGGRVPALHKHLVIVGPELWKYVNEKYTGSDKNSTTKTVQ